MISFTSAQLEALIAAFIFPASRILAVVATVPLLNSAALPRRIRLILGLAITFALAPTLPAMPTVSPTSWTGLWIVFLQILTGVSMGMAIRIVYSAVDLAGEYIGLQMGLSFATFYDPQNTAQTPVISEFINLLTLLLFLSMNGHLMYVATLHQSFLVLPIGPTPLPTVAWSNLAGLASNMFAMGLFLALPILIALMITNLALAVLSRAAPQLNIFSLGFPLTLAGGFISLAACLNYLARPLQELFETGLSAMLSFPASIPH